MITIIQIYAYTASASIELSIGDNASPVIICILLNYKQSNTREITMEEYCMECGGSQEEYGKLCIKCETELETRELKEKQTMFDKFSDECGENSSGCSKDMCGYFHGFHGLFWKPTCIFWELCGGSLII